MPEVIIHDDESFERALKRFKKKCEKAGILSDLRKHRHYEKPSERRKRKMNAARPKTGAHARSDRVGGVRAAARRDERSPETSRSGAHGPPLHPPPRSQE